MYLKPSIRWRLLFLALLPVLFFFLARYFFLLPSIKELMYEAKRAQIVDMIDTGFGILSYYYSQEVEGESSKEIAQQQALEVIRHMNFGPELLDYFWINDYNHTMVMHPIRRDMEGENQFHLIDPEGIFIIREFVEIATTRGGGFVEYKWQLYDDETRIEPKLSYVSAFEPWQWVLGTGIYIHTIESAIERQLRDLHLWSLLFLSALTGIALLISRTMIHPIESITGYAQSLTKGDWAQTKAQPLPQKLMSRRDEVGQLAQSFHIMILQLKKAYSQLEASREDLSITLQSIGDAVIATDVHGQITRMNPKAEQLTGWKIEEAKDRPLDEVFIIVNGKTGEVAKDPTKQVLETGLVVGLANDTELISRDGERYIISDSAAPIYDAQNSIRGAVLVFSDVTEEHRAQQMVKESEERYRHLFHHSPVGLLLEDKEGTIIDLNDSLCSLTGYSREELIGESVEIFVNPEHRSFVRENIAEILKGRDTDLEVESVKKSGEQIYLQLKETRVMLPNGEQGILSIQTDITRRKTVEKENLQKTKWLEALFKDSNDAIIVADRDHCVVDINYSFERLFEYSLEEIKGMPIDRVMDQGKEKSSDSQLTEQLLAGQTVETEGARYNKEGQPIDVLIKGIPIVVDGELVGGYAIYSDITESKKAQERIRYIGFHDRLTDLYNRSYFEHEMQRLDAHERLPISFIMVDLNGLKIINDTYGHSAGDALLTRAAQLLKDSVKEDAMVVRWGGDEFLIFLPHTTGEEAESQCQRILDESRSATLRDIPLQMALGYATKEKRDESIYDVIRNAEDLMYRQKLTENRSARGKIISTLLTTLGEKSDETEEHAWRMQKMAINIGIKLGLPSSELDRLTLLLTLHDIGKITIPEEILTKPGKLNHEEWLAMKSHAEAGSRIAISTEEFAHVAKDILSHHERWDGKGYPQGLKEKKIPLLARITTIVDAYDVMTNGRCYKEAMTKEEAIEELQRCSGSQFDPKLVDLFIESLRENEE